MSEQYITKVQKQHSTLVTSIPLAVRMKLELTKADHIVWQVDNLSEFVQISKVVSGGSSHDRSKGNSDRKDQGG